MHIKWQKICIKQLIICIKKVKIYAEEGVKVVDNNTYVNKGDIIISGAITKDEEIKRIVNE